MSNLRLIHRAILATTILGLLIPVAWIEHDILIHTHGTIAYPLDDAFINLTLAKNLAFEHVWGITKYSFSSASTSLLYPLVLAIIYLVSGASLLVPLLVNGIAAIWLLIAIQRWLIRKSTKPKSQLIVLLAVVLLTPLPVLVISGMEYPVQLLFTFLFITAFSDSTGSALTKKVYIYAILMVATSYETVSLLGVAAIVLLRRRQSWEAAKLIFFSLLPLYLFGLLSVTKHNFFVPTPFFLSWGFHSLAITDTNQLAAAILLLIQSLLALICRDGIRQHAPYRDILLLLAAATACHLLFAPYSAYPHYIDFLTGSTVAVGALLVTQNKKKWLLYPLPVVLALPLVFRSITNFRKAAPTCVDFYTGQYLAARFVYDFYSGYPVASTDLGAISFVDDSRIVDLSGLANAEVFDRKRIRNWTPASADSLSERMNANVAILHHSWSDAEVEPYWYRIATWQTPTDSISFYSIDRRFIQKLETTMHAFEQQLPPGVVVHYFKPIELQ